MKNSIIMSAILLLVSQMAEAQNWSHVGPKSDNQNSGNGFETSRLEDITFDPFDANHMFTSGLFAGLWESTNGGNSWSFVDITAIGSGGVGDVAFLSASEILVGNSYSLGRPPGGGVHQDFSTGIWKYDFMNGTWTALNTFGTGLPPFHIRTIAVRQSIIYVCTSIGLFVSVDAGQTWLQTESGFVEYIVFLDGPGIPAYYCYIAGSNMPGNYGTPTGKIMAKESLDNGFTFTDLSVNLTIPDDISHATICAGPEINGLVRLFLYTIAQTTVGSITTEHDYIQTFTKNVATNNILTSSYQNLSNGIPAGGNGYVFDRLTIEYDPVNDGVWYGGTKLVFKDVTPGFINNTAGVGGWQDLHSRNGVHDDIHDIKWLPGSNKMYVANDGGLMEMTMNPPASPGAKPGVVFNRKNQGLHVCLINGFSGTDADPDLYTVGTQDIINSDVYNAGLGKNVYTHQTWENDGTLIDKFDKKKMFFDHSSYDSYYHTSEDAGLSLVRNKVFYQPKYFPHPTFEPNLTASGVNSYPTLGFTSRLWFQDPHRPDRIFFVKQRGGISQYYFNTGDTDPRKKSVFTRKIDSGSPHFINKFGMHGWSSATAISFSPQTVNSMHILFDGVYDGTTPAISRPSVIKYIGHNINDCWVTHNHDSETNGSLQWADLTSSLWENAHTLGICATPITTIGATAEMYGISLKEIETSPWNKDVIYVLLMVPNHSDIKVLKYDGTNWSNYGNGIPDKEYVYSMILDYQSNDGLYLSTNMGVYFRDASMNSWGPYRTNMPLLPSKQIEINYTENTVRAGTYGQGIWKSNLSCPPGPFTLGPCVNCIGPAIYCKEGTTISASDTKLNATNLAMRATEYVELLPGSGYSILDPSNAQDNYYLLFIHGCAPGQGNTFEADCKTIDISQSSDGRIRFSGLNAPEVLVEVFDSLMANIFYKNYSPGPGAIETEPLAAGHYLARVQFMNSSSGTICFKESYIEIDELVGASETTKDSQIHIFPNPNTGSFTVELPQAAGADMQFRVIDLTGRLVSAQNAQTGSTRQAVEVGAVPAGLYFLQVVSEGKILAIEKFVKQ